ncbi:NFAT activation molecule 1 [Pteropus alecto]|uniref:NFAT activation molecule 1 n=1 Tax=Pteropus alecto TaxID=9402 RepID=L5K8W6_PTEAL|nr:NFAT activation molecule 1 [Pteropus alecto]
MDGRGRRLDESKCRNALSPRDSPAVSAVGRKAAPWGGQRGQYPPLLVSPTYSRFPPRAWGGKADGSKFGGQSVIHTGAPILVSLANKAVSFGCSITYLYTPKFKTFTVSYFHVDLQGQESSKKLTSCQPSTGTENQTHTTQCEVTLKLPSASATGTYYCFVRWPHLRVKGNGTFILVRDTGYQEPPQGSQKILFFCFIGILSVLSVLGTALLLWKKKQMWAPRKQLARKGPAPSTASSKQPPTESVYTVSTQGLGSPTSLRPDSGSGSRFPSRTSCVPL